jgi:hypothetical protein
MYLFSCVIGYLYSFHGINFNSYKTHYNDKVSETVFTGNAAAMPFFNERK